ncbi:hypothetical protein [Pseudonocardia acidicola]|uniref:Uncharacterized protein n=1 Tax=Pseudonocardia acidicola TaxID=2724939 RepID=A0ABX1SER8_9PSEU|nr:hypothetical protein [Pseudonocardia acidicola]NMH98973.1 hypothetical protein [Pseudonocardia acidicola]
MPRGEPDPALRRPSAIDDLDGPGDADPAGPGLPIGTDGADTDGDGDADTVLTIDGADLVLHTDLDGDGLADQVLRIGPGGTTVDATAGPGAAAVRAGAENGAENGSEHGLDAGSAADPDPGPWWWPWRWPVG